MEGGAAGSASAKAASAAAAATAAGVALEWHLLRCPCCRAGLRARLPAPLTRLRCGYCSELFVARNPHVSEAPLPAAKPARKRRAQNVYVSKAWPRIRLAHPTWRVPQVIKEAMREWVAKGKPEGGGEFAGEEDRYVLPDGQQKPGGNQLCESFKRIEKDFPKWDKGRVLREATREWVRRGGAPSALEPPNRHGRRPPRPTADGGAVGTSAEGESGSSSADDGDGGGDGQGGSGSGGCDGGSGSSGGGDEWVAVAQLAVPGATHRLSTTDCAVVLGRLAATADVVAEPPPAFMPLDQRPRCKKAAGPRLVGAKAAATSPATSGGATAKRARLLASPLTAPAVAPAAPPAVVPAVLPAAAPRARKRSSPLAAPALPAARETADTAGVRQGTRQRKAPQRPGEGV